MERSAISIDGAGMSLGGMRMEGGKAWVKARHQIVHDVIRYPARLFLFLLYGLRVERYRSRRGSGPFLILCNHTTPLDPVCLGTSFDFPVYYVASDHIFRLGWLSRMLVWLVAPIPIVKSRLDLQTIKDTMTVLRQGGSGCLFPEGNRNYNGESVGFSQATAKLAKRLGVPLLLYRFEGGYFTAPRWADTVRRGRLAGRVVREVSVEEMAVMTVGELHGLIRRELQVDAYDGQSANPVRYRGKRLAESLERMLYLCPRCHGMATLKTVGDTVSCGCGLEARYTEYGFLEPAGRAGQAFGTVLEWDRWQKRALAQWLRDRLEQVGGKPLLEEGGLRLYTCGRAGNQRLAGRGRLALRQDSFRFIG